MSRYFLSFFSVVVVCASSVVNAAACSENSLSIQIVDEIRGPRVTSILEVSDPVFQNFAGRIYSHVKNLIQESGDCVGEDVSYSSLLFVRKPLVQNRPVTPLPNSSSESAFNGCRLSSPWVDFEFDNSATPKVRGVIRWNQRQLLIDQAMMAGDIQVADERVAVLSGDDYRKYAKAYVDSEFYRKPKVLPLSSLMPLDILWLFRNSLQSTRGPFASGALRAMDNLMGRSTEGYTDLVISLIDRCVSSGQGDLRYESILDLKGVVPIDKYRVEKLL